MNHVLVPHFCRKGLLGLTAGLAICLATATPVYADDSNLPSLGGVGGGLISEQQEAAIGQQVLQSIRRSTPEIGDPLVLDYLSTVVHRLLPYAALQNRNLSMVVIDSDAINAFAVPGGVIGVNGGLFLNAETEQEFASVMAHELGHLVQRHFARRMERQEQNAPLAMAGMLAGIILSAVTKSDVGIATIAGSQAAAVQNMLQYSRSNEREADRVGLDMLAAAGFDPHGMPEMFEIMMRQSRLQGSEVPEYLSTHPLTQNRISDSRSRANQYPSEDYQDSMEYHLVRARVMVHYAQTPEKAVEIFQQYVDQKDTLPPPSARYGLAVAKLAADDAAGAEKILKDLLNDYPGRITFQVTLAETLTREKKTEEAISLMDDALHRNPGNYPIRYQLADSLYAGNHAQRAAEVYSKLANDYPDKAYIWLKLSDAEGQARNIVGVHRARAEYYLLMGDHEAAIRQLREAQNKAPPGTPTREIVTQRLSQITRAMHEAQQ
ncbi:M48 family peptidase [Marinobacter sp. R17]|uniref:M48 family metalloprotease n=1 Tax=Marinobacter sp. R17 TaxID=2484250 RepID=UPI000F4C7C2B|nr:M48 family metalloprotease [Marinobacter sp. R17]ROT99591.1 M48 family peptidase [Marinobacter sp. R17]